MRHVQDRLPLAQRLSHHGPPTGKLGLSGVLVAIGAAAAVFGTAKTLAEGPRTVRLRLRTETTDSAVSAGAGPAPNSCP
jgi:hypothetical protein